MCGVKQTRFRHQEGRVTQQEQTLDMDRTGGVTLTSIGKALKLTVCSEPLWFSFPQWKRTSLNSYSWSLGRGPPVTTETAFTGKGREEMI